MSADSIARYNRLIEQHKLKNITAVSFDQLMERRGLGGNFQPCTHLVANGTPAFWLDVMQLWIAEFEDKRDLEIWPNKDKSSFVDCIGEEGDTAMPEIPLFDGVSVPNFSNDVVYSLWSLCGAFGISRDGFDEEEIIREGHLSLESNVDSLFGPNITGDGQSFISLCGKYSVWNARLQKVQHRYGISNNLLLALMKKSTSLRQLVEASFGAAPSAGLPLPNKLLDSIYSPRHALKEDMISQYPHILNLLRNRVLSECYSDGIQSVAFSVSGADVSRPWMWRHLVDNAGFEDATINVVVHYLTGAF